MKNILLASTAIVAFAGAAAAEVSFSGSATLGFNDTVAAGGGDNNEGFYIDGDLNISLSQELDNGIVAGIDFEIDFADDDSGAGNSIGNIDIDASDVVLSLVAGDTGLYFGDTGTAAIAHWSSVGSMDSDGFTEGLDFDAGVDAVLRGDFGFGGMSASVSYLISDDLTDMEQLSLGLSGDLGGVTVSFAYQDETALADGSGDFSASEVFGLSATTTLSGAEVSFGYASNETAGTDSIGVGVSYPVGPVTISASYVSEDAADNWDIGFAYADGPISIDVTTDESDDWGIEGSYDLGNGVMIYAGLDDAGDDTYLAATYDLGGGASVLFSYADDSDADNGDDEIGAGDYQEGITLELGFSF